ncbi:MAG: protein kinase [Anaerolineaceae bacterium]|nr:protein kinase [Anaerolineaceae bacterium]
MTLDIGSLLYNRYRILDIIAKGGMGAIYRATDENLGVQVALKENLILSEEASRQFRLEATILGGLRHPNLPRVTDHFEIENQGQYLVMDYVDGNDLRQLIADKGILPEDEIVFIGAAACDALAYLHSQHPPIIHRDIKPGNIKITPNGQVFLVDFGLAKIEQPGQSTTTGAQALTPGYSPPEQYGRGTSSRSDIYSLGATLYAIATGKIPEDGLARAIGSATLTPIRNYNSKMSENTAAVIEKAMAVAQDSRYPTAEDFKNALLNSNSIARQKISQTSQISKDSIVPSPEIQSSTINSASPTIRPSKPLEIPLASSVAVPARQSKVPIIPITGGLLVILIIVISGVFWLFKGFSSHQAAQSPTLPVVIQVKVQATTRLAISTNTPAPLLTATSTFQPAATSLVTTATTPTAIATTIGGGSGQLAFASKRDGSVQIWMMDLQDNIEKQITNLPDGACQPGWSPDGKRLVFTSPCQSKQDIYKGSALFIINSDGSGLTPLISLPGGDFDPAWSPDGSKIAFCSIREGIPHIYLYSINDASVTRLTSPSSNDQHPAWSSDGKWIAFVSSRLGSSQVWIMAPDGSSAHEFSALDKGSAYTPAWSPDSRIIVFGRGSNQPWLVSKQFTTQVVPESDINNRIRSVYNPVFSQDGFWLIFEYDNNGNSQLYRMTINGSNLNQVTNDSGSNFQPVLRPVLQP